MIQRVSEILKDMKGKASAEAALLTSSDGLVLGAVQDDGIELESLAAYAASNMMTSERMGESVDCGIPESVIVIYQDKAVVMAPLGPVVAIMIGSSITQVGNLRLQMKRAMVDLSAALRDEMEMKAESQKGPAMAPEAAVEEIAVPTPAPEVQKTSVDPELNGNGRRTAPPTRRGSSINLK
ncbi:MAG: roadblock/LC7 domain-containing protein [bacterium]